MWCGLVYVLCGVVFGVLSGEVWCGVWYGCVVCGVAWCGVAWRGVVSWCSPLY